MLNSYVRDSVDPSRWDKFVEAHPLGWICQTSAWLKVLQDAFPHIKPRYLFLAEDETAPPCAALPLCLIQSLLRGRRLVSLPYATLCDPLVQSNDEFRRLLDGALALHRQQRCRLLEIRGFHGQSLLEDARITPQERFVHHELPLDQPQDKLLKTFHLTCVRQRINKAERAEIEVIEGTSEADLHIFFELHRMTRRRLGLPPHPYRFLHAMWVHLRPLGALHLMLARHAGTYIAGILFLNYKDRISIEYSALDERWTGISPVHLLFWRAIQWGQNAGYRVLDFGRTDPANTGLMTFKSHWGTRASDIWHYGPPANAAQEHLAPGHEGKRTQFMRRCLARVIQIMPSVMLDALGRLAYWYLS